MNDINIVRISIQLFKDSVNRLRHRKRAAFLEFVLESAGPGDLHRDYREALDFLAAENVETVRMVDACGQATFAEKPLPHVRRIQLLPQHFQGDAATGGNLFSFVNRAHAAAPEQSKQPVAAEFTGELRVYKATVIRLTPARRSRTCRWVAPGRLT